MAKLWLEWNSTTTQEARNKANDNLNYVETCRIFAKNSTKMRSNSRRNGESVAGVELRQQHSKHENRNVINNRDKKYEDRLEMSVHNGTYVS